MGRELGQQGGDPVAAEHRRVHPLREGAVRAVGRDPQHREQVVADPGLHLDEVPERRADERIDLAHGRGLASRSSISYR